MFYVNQPLNLQKKSEKISQQKHMYLDLKVDILQLY